MAWPIDGGAGAAGGAQFNDIASKLQMGNQIAAQMLDLWSGLFPRSMGQFTMSATASKVVSDAGVKSSSYVVLVPTNAAAATLQGSAKCLYVAYASGTFTVTTGSGAAAAGTEAFQYLVFNAL